MELEKEIKILNLDDILPNRFQPRIKFNEKAILELAESIKKHGVIQPIVVRPLSDKYEIIAGERRYKASLLAGKTTIPAIITSLDDRNSAEIALIENVQRENLTPIEEAISYRKILDMDYMNQTELAEKLGKTQSTIANKLRLLNLEEEVQEALMDLKISERHARSLLRLSGSDQIKMLDRIIKERLTVRATDKAIEEVLKNRALEDEIEILDFDEETEGGKPMNNQFNIPSSPIIGDEPPTPPVSETQPMAPVPEVVAPIPEVVEVVPNYIENPANPGFMDVDKIVNQAQDIYTPPRKEADLDALLKTDPVEVAPPPIATPVTPEPSAPTGKFFNFFQNPSVQEENPNFVENLEKKEVNMDFGIPTPNQSSNFNPFDLNPNSLNTESNPVEPTSSPIAEIPPVSSPESFVSLEQPTIVPPEAPVQERVASTMTDVSPVIPVNTAPLVEPDYNFNFDDDDDTPPTPSVYQLNEEDHFTQPSTIAEPSVTPVVVSSESSLAMTNNLKTVINTIRECVSTIERYGFAVDLEELDFEDSYQVTIKVQKKD